MRAASQTAKTTTPSIMPPYPDDKARQGKARQDKTRQGGTRLEKAQQDELILPRSHHRLLRKWTVRSPDSPGPDPTLTSSSTNAGKAHPLALLAEASRMAMGATRLDGEFHSIPLALPSLSLLTTAASAPCSQVEATLLPSSPAADAAHCKMP
ncbi:hypothetical protein MKX07_002205 [Trichoderma sp. CBMAI-0711]|nr:hypothetical protein MKX07_002205 [Trichoderma sp. CBMAI-0711]